MILWLTIKTFHIIVSLNIIYGFKGNKARNYLIESKNYSSMKNTFTQITLRILSFCENYAVFYFTHIYVKIIL